ncbi:flagellar hook-length control protein FliK [Alteromonas sp. ASW11-130]|uniref:flagellar hook-length control protein FliK n=1 Tax=Alteromonas sp. ASW11-130 TaxID=3015775 RepID=UPI00224247AA|nr:flagellar hook-length control protein FliK [Alteromonas sp. ASW11-130]MCW8092822.1 flagellar hook-length control protein FliK [Alteromonas sp. ASW11-130]
MNLNIPLDGSSFPKGPDTGTANSVTNNAAQLQAKVALARLPDQVMRLQPQSTNISDAFHVKVPSSFSFKDGAQHQLARTSSSINPKPVLIEHTSLTHRAAVSPEQANKIAEAVSRAIPVNTSLSTGTIQATVVHAPGSQISLRLALPGSPIVNVSLSQSVNLTQGDKIQLSLSQPTANELRVSINSPAPKNTLITEIKLSPNHILAQQFTKMQLTGGVSISPQLLKGIVDKVGLASINSSGSSPITLTLKNNQVAVTTFHSQAIAKLALSKEVTRTLPILSGSENIKSLPQLVPFDPLPSKLGETNISKSQGISAQSIESMTKSQVHDAIVQLSRRLLNETGSTREALNQLITTLNSPNSSTSANTIALMKGLSQQLTQGLVAEESGALKVSSPSNAADTPAKPPSLQSLQALFSSPSLPLSNQALISPVTQSNFVSGLVAVLQMTFAGRAIRNQPQLGALADKEGSFLSKSLAQLGTAGPASKVSQEFSRLDGQRQMLENIKTLLANHRQHKLTNVDHRLQGQESFYYVLPVNSQNQAPPEVLLKREDHHNNNENSTDVGSKVWNFTMKLDIDELGKLLVKSKVSSTTLNLHLYTSSDALLSKIKETLPMLLKRLSELGLTIEHSSYQRGKIPETLGESPYQLFETHA